MIKVLLTLGLLCASLIGAGISSGREIYEFFFRFGVTGLICCALAGVVVFVLLDKLQKIANDKKIVCYSDLNNYLFPTTHSITFICYNVSLFISAAAMLSGMQSLIGNLFGVTSFPLVSIVVSIIMLFVLKGGIQGILKISAPLSIIMLILIFTNITKSIKLPIVNNITSGSIGLSTIYMLLFVCGNIAMLIEIILSTHTKKGEKIIKICLSVFVSVLLITMFLALKKVNGNLANIDMPLLNLAKQSSALLYKLYLIAIIVAMFTTLISAQHTLKQNMTKLWLGNKNLYVIIFLSFLFSLLPFTYIVKYGYFLSGVIGLVTCARLIFIKR